MSYIVLARKYRPQTFDEVVGQEYITKTLKNAIEAKRIYHAYLFAGPRGVGKTSIARILAKAINCEKGPAANPCGKCNSCKEITEGNSPDVIEIDGASNRGIDDIRDLREKVKYAPVKSKNKVYIIDEVHMLTNEAFNALLKTLEEPPQHAYFIFATPEMSKVPLTIGSRCQKFNFRKLSVTEIVNNLAEILKKEKIKVDPKVLGLIAKNSDGALRDAESILDQVISLGGGEIKYEDVELLVGSVNDELLRSFSSDLINKNTEGVLVKIDELFKTGADVFHFVAALIEYFRNVLIVKLAKQTDNLMDIADAAELKALKEVAEKLAVDKILNIIKILTSLLEGLKYSSSSRILVEVAAVKITRLDELVEIGSMLNRLDELQQGMSSNKQTYVPVQGGVKATLSAEPSGGDLKISDIEEVELSGEGDEGLEKITKNWQVLVEKVKETKRIFASVLSSVSPVGFAKDTLYFEIRDDYLRSQLELESNLSVLKEAFKEIFKKDITVSIKKMSAQENGSEADIRPSGSEKRVIDKKVDPIVKAANSLFGGRIMNKDEHGRL